MRVLIGLLAVLLGCPSEQTKPLGTPDTGPADTGRVLDAAPPPPPPDSGPPDESCTGREGCDCVSTLGPNDVVFRGDDCDAGLLCVPWDLITGTQGNLLGPVQSCVRPCASDTDCSPAQFCSGSMGFTPDSGADRFCVDELAPRDHHCGGSRLSASQIVGVQLETAGVMVGCEGDTSCAFGVFADVHPDEGICLDLCEQQADCTDAAARYCNPILDGGTGVCSVARLGSGAICGSTDPNSAGLTTRCDADPTSPVHPDRGGCLGTNLYGGAGFCGQFCGSANPCIGMDDSEPFQCEIFDPADPMQGGFCTSECTNFPEDCGGDGVAGLGRFCFENRVVIGQQPNQVTIRMCMDRRGPTIGLTTFERNGAGFSNEGGNCDDPSDLLSFTRCDESSGAHCFPLAANMGRCIAGCTLDVAMPAGPQGGCEGVSTTSTCTPALSDPVLGACSD